MTTPETEPLNTEPEAAAEAEQAKPVSICVCGHHDTQHEALKCTAPDCSCDYLTEDTGATIEANAAASEAADAPAEPDTAPAEASADTAQESEPEQATEAAGKRKRKAKPVQLVMPEMGERDIEAIVQAAEKYRELRDERMLLSKQEKDAKENLIQVMRNYQRTVYNYRGLRIELSEEISVSVKAKDDADSAAAKRETRRMVADIESVVIERQQQAEPTPEESLANAEAFLAGNAAPEGVGISTEPGQDSTIDAQASPEAAPDEESESGAKYAGVYSFDEYVAYARFLDVKMANACARKWQLTGERDGMVKAWLSEGLEAANERKAAKATAPKPQSEPKRRDRRNRNRHANA